MAADSVRFLGGGRGDGAAPGAPGGNGNCAAVHVEPVDEEEIPF